MASLQANGIPFSRLINSSKHNGFLELIKCKKCFNILLNPYDCSVCGNSFCYECINSLLSQSKSCPFKCVSYSINPSSFSITSYLSAMQFDCLNKKNGCYEILDYNSLITHDKDCKYFYTKCPNGGCGKSMKWTLLENHIIKECDYSLFKCPNCEMELSRNQFNEHVTNCTNIRKSLSYSINPNPNTQQNNTASQQDNQKKLDDLLKHLPEIKEMSLVSFLKILLYQINESNKTLNNKFDSMRDEMKGIHEDINRVCNNNMIFFESINNELESLNNKCNTMELSDSVKANIQESVQNALGNSQNDTTSSLADDKKMLNNSMMSDYMPTKQRVKFAEILESTDKFKNTKEKQAPKQNQGLKEKRVKTLNLNKSMTTSSRKEREGNYSPRGNGHNNNYITSTPNSDSMNSSIDINRKGESSNVSITGINPPIARPFNTFSNFTNSNLVTIINNQEVILKKLNHIETKMNDKEQKLLDEIKETQDSYYNQMLLSSNVSSKLKEHKPNNSIESNENQCDQ